MKFKTVFATLATTTLTARSVKTQNGVLVITLGRDASRILMDACSDARDVDALKAAYHDAGEQERLRRECSAYEVYASQDQGGHMVYEYQRD